MIAGCYFYAYFQEVNDTVNIIVRKNGITLSGHAGYAPRGQDIVCAAISILTYTLQNSFNKLTDDTVGFNYAQKGVEISFSDLSPQGQIILNSFIVGVELLADSYSGYVNLTKR